MNTSLFELFKIGIGPSSSHTVGPMRAALRFVRELDAMSGRLSQTARLRAELYGSLAFTGIGHGTDRAVLLGLSGEAPDTIDPETIDATLEQIRSSQILSVGGTHRIAFTESTDLIFHRDQMYPPGSEAATSHPNGLRFTALAVEGQVVFEQIFYSVGGGFILSASELAPNPEEKSVSPRKVPYSFSSAAELLSVAERSGLTIAELILANECALLEAEEANQDLKPISRPLLSGGNGIGVKARVEGEHIGPVGDDAVLYGERDRDPGDSSWRPERASSSATSA